LRSDGAGAMLDVALVTSAEFADLVTGDRLLLTALQGRGLSAAPVVWDDPGADWRRIRFSIIRSTWDYIHRLGEFLAWAERAAALTDLWNPIEVLRWNTHKSYLRGLASRGVPVVPTLHLPAGSGANLAALLEDAGWQKAVVKPAVSAYAYETMLVSRESVAMGQAHIDRLLPTADLMVQPYMASVADYGERSMIFVRGELTHGVRRAPMLETRDETQEQEATRVEASAEEVALAERVLRAAGHRYLYARVDIVRDNNGSPMLMELEMVEPSLFFELAPEAAQRCADAIFGMLQSRRAEPRV
jgi:hypothetical protein